eukprot:TRINITY_DN8921_c0_g1_i1.p1 TRINITY_DN8921_c0_g1~~TRINITY_DN8921_c0_g1_i1.p1  ORF type:complete len:171 (+),score=11.29 TRINITY_DN8921_c0_g1_i1:11-523(+)
MSTPRWTSSHCGSSGQISDNNTLFTKISKSGWNCGGLAMFSIEGVMNSSFRVKFKLENLGSNGVVMIGISQPRLFNCDSLNFNYCGWYLNCCNGALFSGSGDSCREYLPSPPCVGQTVEVIWNQENRTISYVIDGVDKGVAFSGVDYDPSEPLCPAVEIYEQNGSVRIVE